MVRAKLKANVKKYVKWTLISLFSPVVRRFLRLNNKLILVGVAGSVAKTSTKFAITQILKEGAGKRVLVHEGAYNDPFSTMFVLLGVDYPNINNPLAIFRAYLSLRKSSKLLCPYDYVVLEMGTDMPGEMRQFAKYLSLDIGVLTAITPEHMVNFSSFDEVAQEELELVKYSKKVLVCRDLVAKRYQKEIESRSEGTAWYGSAENNKVVVSAGELVDVGLKTRRQLKLKFSGRSFVIKSALLHLHSGLVMAGAVLVAIELGVMSDGAVLSLEGLASAAGRGRILAGKKGSVIIDDSYNNVGPNVSIAALDLLYEFKTRRRIVVLGGINEMSEDLEREAHTEVALHLNKKKLEEVILIGLLAKKYYVPILKTSEIKFKWFANPYKAGNYLQNKLVAGMVVLVKGSQNGIYSEEAIKDLLQDEGDKKLLVRQSEAWLSKKRRSFGL
jgi:UDP-N-acetylmuramoyl-tripeptide--D-alanyl-D-alanine ligase